MVTNYIFKNSSKPRMLCIEYLAWNSWAMNAGPIVRLSTATQGVATPRQSLVCLPRNLTSWTNP